MKPEGTECVPMEVRPCRDKTVGLSPRRGLNSSKTGLVASSTLYFKLTKTCFTMSFYAMHCEMLCYLIGQSKSAFVASQNKMSLRQPLISCSLTWIWTWIIKACANWVIMAKCCKQVYLKDIWLHDEFSLTLPGFLSAQHHLSCAICHFLELVRVSNLAL